MVKTGENRSFYMILPLNVNVINNKKKYLLINNCVYVGTILEFISDSEFVQSIYWLVDS